MLQQHPLDRVEQWIIYRKARQLVGKPFLPGEDINDIKQNLTVDVLERLAKHDPGKSNRDTFVPRVVNRCAATMSERGGAIKRGPRIVHQSLNDLVHDHGDRGHDTQLDWRRRSKG